MIGLLNDVNCKLIIFRFIAEVKRLTYICSIEVKPINNNDMKQYNLSEIMKKAHQLYKNARAKYPTFSDVLKRSWKSAKFSAHVEESIKAIKAEKEAQKAREQEEREQAQIRSILFTAELEAQRIKREAEAKAERMRDEIAARKQGMSIRTRSAGQWVTGAVIIVEIETWINNSSITFISLPTACYQ